MTQQNWFNYQQKSQPHPFFFHVGWFKSYNYGQHLTWKTAIDLQGSQGPMSETMWPHVSVVFE